MAEPTRADREDRDAHLDLDLGLGLFGNPNAMPPGGGFRADDEGAAAEGDDEGAAAEGDDEGAAAEGDDDLTPWGAEYDEFAPCEPPPDAGGADAAAGGAGAGGDAAGPVDFGAPLRALIPALLADDARHRVPGVTGGLYSLRDLEGLPRGVPGCGVPVVCAGTPGLWGTAAGGPWSPEVRNRPVIDDAAFAEEFAVALTEVMRGVAAQLRGFDLRRHGMVVAGGFPAGVLAGRPETAGDVDIFLVGHPDDEARRAAITALYRHLLAAGHRGRDGDRPVPYVGVHRTRGCVTFYPNMRGGCTPIQVVLRAYSSVSEVLHGFDLGAAQVAFDGERVFLTALGVFAATRGVNILNLAVRRVSYEARLARYLSRGYALVVPDLDVGAFRERRAGLPFASGYPPPGAVESRFRHPSGPALRPRPGGRGRGPAGGRAGRARRLRGRARRARGPVGPGGLQRGRRGLRRGEDPLRGLRGDRPAQRPDPRGGGRLGRRGRRGALPARGRRRPRPRSPRLHHAAD
jgi:hypothetical protein